MRTLCQRSWTGNPGVEHFDDVVGFLNRSEIYDVLQPLVTGLSRSLIKAELVEFALQNVSPLALHEAL